VYFDLENPGLLMNDKWQKCSDDPRGPSQAGKPVWAGFQMMMDLIENLY